MTKTSKTTLFISDLHLEPQRPDITQAFLDFLKNTAPQAEALYILGDFFNVWIGDDNRTELSQLVSSALKNLSLQGTSIYLMHGNRDFLMGQAFAVECSAQLISEPYLLESHGQQFLLLHGDSLCTLDQDYMQFRSMVRQSQWQQQFLANSLKERQAYADQARAQSKDKNSNKAQDIMDVTPAEVEKIMQAHKVTTLIHGHTHRPAVHEFDLNGDTAKRVVLGDWDKKAWYLELANSTLSLLELDIAG